MILLGKPRSFEAGWYPKNHLNIILSSKNQKTKIKSFQVKRDLKNKNKKQASLR
jgi:hypothetical protein